MRFFFWATVIFLLQSAAAQSANEAVPVGRLPSSVRPTHYQLHLNLDPVAEEFSGSVEITAQLDQAQDFIWLHGNALKVSRVSARTIDGDVIGEYAQMDASGVARLRFPVELPKGELQLKLDFDGSYSKKLDGIYKVIDAGRPYLFTQFESVFARQMFPSFDEPGFKTPFDVSISIPKELKVIFNTPEQSSTTEGNLRTVRFQTTQKLPTYLLAVVVGDLDIIEFAPIPPNAIRQQPLPFRGVATKGKGKLMQYALENTAPIVAQLEHYFATPYPFEKLDIIAVPDFASGAMENAGAITYREQLLLIKPDGPIAQKVAYTGTHAHELAHQWFGNLVTPMWWDDIWLNEAFATWMGLKIGGAVQPNSNFRNRVQSGALGAMDLDSLKSARQIRNAVNDKNEIVGAFDSITYRKGGGVLAMFEAYMGEDKFREGIRIYLKRHAHGNASAKDFLRALAEAANDPSISPAFESFLTQNGLPTVQVRTRCTADGAEVALKQSRFQGMSLATHNNSEAAKSSQSWQLPMCLRFPDGKTTRVHCEMLSALEQTIALETNRCPKWLLPNANGAGYLRFSMADKDWQALLNGASQLSSAEVLSVQDSLSASFFEGTISAEQYLARVPKIIRTNQSDAIVASITTARFLFDFMLPQDSRTQRKARTLYLKTTKSLGLDPTTKQDRLAPAANAELRLRTLEFAALVARDPKLRKQLLARGVAFLGLDGQAPNASAISTDLLELALAVTVQERDLIAINALKSALTQSSDAIFRAQALRALARVENVKQSQLLREFALNDSLRGNEVMLILTGQANQPATRDAAWQWFQRNFERVLVRLSEKSHTQVFELAASRCDAQDADSVRTFFADKLVRISNGPRGLANTLERIDRCTALREKNSNKTTN